MQNATLNSKSAETEAATTSERVRRFSSCRPAFVSRVIRRFVIRLRIGKLLRFDMARVDEIQTLEAQE